jgi:hypothetical protein
MDSQGNSNWLLVLARFYNFMHDEVIRQWQEKCKKECPDYKSDEIELWKAIGDEVVFRARIFNPIQSIIFIESVISAANSFDEILSNMSGKRLHLKCTAWVAGFPKNNHIIFIPNSSTDISKVISDQTSTEHAAIAILSRNHQEYEDKELSSNYRLDYVGQSMDIGFRLSKHSTKRKFAISVELCYILSDMMHKINKRDKIYIRYDDVIILKGVLGERGYPFFWIDMIGSISPSTSLDRISSRNDLLPIDIKGSCEAFINTTDNELCIPYIVERKNDTYLSTYNEIPDDHKDYNDKILKELDKQNGKDSSLEESYKILANSPDSSTLPLNQKIQDGLQALYELLDIVLSNAKNKESKK